MGTYYQASNYDKREIISLSYITNIKYGSFHCWTLQVAILTVFLGADYHRQTALPPGWVGRWAGNRVFIENDGADNESDWWFEDRDSMTGAPVYSERDRERSDVGMLFLAELQAKGLLQKWLTAIELKFPPLDSDLKDLQEWSDKYYA